MSGRFKFNADRDIPDLSGKIFFVTGGTAGLGKDCVQAIAKHSPDHIYFTGRNSAAADVLISDVGKTSPTVGLTFIEMDLTSLVAIQTGMKKFTHSRLDVLICNAGIMAVPLAVSKDGYEIQFATNHLGNSLITQHLLPTLLRTADTPKSDVRIVNVTSTGFMFATGEGISFSGLKSRQPCKSTLLPTWRCYSESKLANVLYAVELARRYPSITSTSIHPGVVNTGLVTNLGLWNRIFIWIGGRSQSVALEDGCLNHLWAATGARRSELVSGAFYMPVGVESNSSLTKQGKDKELAKRLWDWTDEALKNYL